VARAAGGGGGRLISFIRKTAEKFSEYRYSFHTYI
jgi:hypothetical protein